MLVPADRADQTEPWDRNWTRLCETIPAEDFAVAEQVQGNINASSAPRISIGANEHMLLEHRGPLITSSVSQHVRSVPAWRRLISSRQLVVLRRSGARRTGSFWARRVLLGTLVAEALAAHRGCGFTPQLVLEAPPRPLPAGTADPRRSRVIVTTDAMSAV